MELSPLNVREVPHTRAVKTLNIIRVSREESENRSREAILVANEGAQLI